MRHDDICFLCESCRNVMIAPKAWIGMSVRCSLCDARRVVPATGDAEPPCRQSPHEAARHTPSGGTLAGRARNDDLVITVDDTEVLRDRDPAQLKRTGDSRKSAVRKFLRRWRYWLIGGAVVLGVAGWAISWKWYYQHYVKAEAIMRSRGYGRQLSEPLTDNSSNDLLVSRVQVAEARSFEKPEDLSLAMDLLAAYEHALAEIDKIPRWRASSIMNNASWLLSTTPHIGLRDPERALKLANAAVAATNRKNPGFLDTLAEAKSINNDHVGALETAREALNLLPEDSYLRGRLTHFETTVESASN